MALVWNPLSLAGFLGGALLWALAVVVFRAGAGRFQNRAVAFLLLAEGGVLLGTLGLRVSTDSFVDAYAVFLVGMLCFTWVPLALLASYGSLPGPAQRVLSAPTTRWALVVAGLAWLGASLVVPELVIASMEWNELANAYVVRTFGPLMFVHLATLVVVTVAGIPLTSFAVRHAPTNVERTRARAFRAGLVSYIVLRALPFAYLGVRVALEPTTGPSTFDLTVIWGGLALGDVALVVFLSCGILRHQLFDIDVKIKFALRQSTVAATFIAVFFVVSESAAALLSDRIGTYVGIAAAGLLVFAISPLHRLAERLSDRAMPGVKPVAHLTGDERLALYRDQLTAAYADGSVDANKRRLLEVTRERLAIEAGVASHVERDVLQRLAGR